MLIFGKIPQVLTLDSKHCRHLVIRENAEVFEVEIREMFSYRKEAVGA